MSDSQKSKTSKGGMLRRRLLVKSNRNEQGDGNQFVSDFIGHFLPSYTPRHLRYRIRSYQCITLYISKVLVEESKHQHAVVNSHYIPVDPESLGQETAVSEKACVCVCHF